MINVLRSNQLAFRRFAAKRKAVNTLYAVMEVLFALSLLLLAASGGVDAAQRLADLTHTFNSESLYWPTITADRFRFYKTVTSRNGSVYNKMNMFCAAEHGGTHMDAPNHFALGKKSVDQVQLSQLVGHMAVIDVKEKSRLNHDYLVGESDFLAYEKKNGRIPNNTIIILNSGETRIPSSFYQKCQRGFPQKPCELFFNQLGLLDSKRFFLKVPSIFSLS